MFHSVGVVEQFVIVFRLRTMLLRSLVSPLVVDQRHSGVRVPVASRRRSAAAANPVASFDALHDHYF